MALGERKLRMVGNGCVRWDGEYYYDDELTKYSGLKLEVTYFKHDPRYVFVYLPDNKIIVAEIEAEYNFLDAPASGAIEQKRRKIITLLF